MGDLKKLKSLVFEQDNKACFIERERILSRIEAEQANYKENQTNRVLSIFRAHDVHTL